MGRKGEERKGDERRGDMRKPMAFAHSPPSVEPAGRA